MSSLRLEVATLAPVSYLKLEITGCHAGYVCLSYPMIRLVKVGNIINIYILPGGKNVLFFKQILVLQCLVNVSSWF